MSQSRIRNSYRTFNLFTVATIALALSATSIRAEQQAASADEWTIEIVPRSTLVVDRGVLAENERPIITPLRTAQVEGGSQPPETVPAPPRPGDEDPETPPETQAAAVPFDASLYKSIYSSIPFSRAEYVANPGYRHQATMSIILGQPYAVTPVNYRPQVLDSHPLKWRPGRTVFGYRPLYLRSYWWPGYYGRPYWAY